MNVGGRGQGGGGGRGWGRQIDQLSHTNKPQTSLTTIFTTNCKSSTSTHHHCNQISTQVEDITSHQPKTHN